MIRFDELTINTNTMGAWGDNGLETEEFNNVKEWFEVLNENAALIGFDVVLSDPEKGVFIERSKDGYIWVTKVTHVE